MGAAANGRRRQEISSIREGGRRGKSYEFYTSGAVTQTLHTGSVLIQRLLLSIWAEVSCGTSNNPQQDEYVTSWLESRETTSTGSGEFASKCSRSLARLDRRRWLQ